jgi:probable rRNA maturation factor
MSEEGRASDQAHEAALDTVRAAWGAARLTLLAEVEPRFVARIDLHRIATVAAATLAHEGLAGESEISLVVTDDATIRQLNAADRGVDRETDVLSYPQILPGEAMPLAPDGVRRLGDVVISYERAQAQAAEVGHSVEREIDVLVAHGVLHLLGYTDYTPEDKAAMLARGDAVLASLFGGMA